MSFNKYSIFYCQNNRILLNFPTVIKKLFTGSSFAFPRSNKLNVIADQLIFISKTFNNIHMMDKVMYIYSINKSIQILHQVKKNKFSIVLYVESLPFIFKFLHDTTNMSIQLFLWIDVTKHKFIMTKIYFS